MATTTVGKQQQHRNQENSSTYCDWPSFEAFLHLLDGDGGEEAARAGTLFAVAEEKIWVARGAEAGGEDIFLAEASGQELGTIGFG